jgi:Domain of unknown function (DUF4383)
MNLARGYSIVFGVVYTLVGLIGFTVSTSLEVHTLVVFPVNIVHNFVHLLVGLIGIGAFFTGQAVAYCRGMAVVFAILTLAGFLPQPLLGIVPIGGADIPLHAATAILAALAGWLYSANRQQATA